MTAGTFRPAPAPDLPVRPRPQNGARWFVTRTEDGRSVYVDRAVIRHIRTAEAVAHPNETGGLLFGRAFIDGGDCCTLVTDLVTPRPGEVDGSPARVTISAEGSFRMMLRGIRQNPLAEVVGWWHTHPLYPAFYSSVDLREQAAWPDRHSVGIVLSGLRDADPPFRVFVGPRSAEARLGLPATLDRHRRGLGFEPVDRDGERHEAGPERIELASRDADGRDTGPESVDGERDRGDHDLEPEVFDHLRSLFGTGIAAPDATADATAEPTPAAAPVAVRTEPRPGRWFGRWIRIGRKDDSREY